MYLLAARRDGPCFCITPRTMAFRMILPPQEMLEPTALSLLSARITTCFTAVVCVCVGGVSVHLIQRVDLASRRRTPLRSCLRRARFAPPAEAPPAEAHAAKRPVVDTSVADRPPPTLIDCLRLRDGLASADAAPTICSYSMCPTVAAA